MGAVGVFRLKGAGEVKFGLGLQGIYMWVAGRNYWKKIDESDTFKSDFTCHFYRRVPRLRISGFFFGSSQTREEKRQHD